MPEGIKFPEFPSAFTEEDVERKKFLEEQRKALEIAYQTKFSQRAWAGTTVAEKAIRKVTPTWVAPLAKALPGQAETLEFGLTPEQFREQQQEVEEEFKELARREKVTELLPTIQSDILLAAISGNAITDISDLKTTFPELSKDFTEEEIGYLARLSEAVLKASPEQILSGELFATEPSQLPISEEDILESQKAGKGIPYATVLFAKGVEEVTAALKQSYAPKPEEVPLPESVRQKMQEYFQQRNIELGITPERPTKQALKDLHAKIAEEAGESVTLVNQTTGELIAARRMSDGIVYVNKEPVAYMTEEGKLGSFNLQGQPVLEKEIEESLAKDYWDAWYLASNQAGMGVEKFFTSILPDALLSVSEKVAPFTVIGDEKAKELAKKNIQAWRGELKARYDKSQSEFRIWLKDHPELAPRPEWIENPEENPKQFINPGRIGYVILSNAPIMATALAAGLGTMVLTGNPVAGAIAGASIMLPTQTAEIVDDAVAEGASFEDATVLGTVVGTAISAVEIFPGMVALKIIAPGVMSLFGKELSKQATKQVVKNLVAKGIIGTGKKIATNMLKIEAVEVLEENIQQVMQNSFVKIWSENRGVFDNLLQTTIDTFWAVSPLAFMGGATTYFDIKHNLPPEIQAGMDDTSDKLQDAGLTQEHAEAVALSQVVETETGQAQVKEAIKKSEEKIGTCYEDAWRFQNGQGEGILVHGSVTGADGITVKHAWVEFDTGFIYEPQSEQFIKKTVFERTFKPIEDNRYSTEEAAIQLARKGYHGAWAEDKTAEQSIAPSKIEKLQSQLSIANEEIASYETSIKTQEDRLTKLTLPNERAELQETLTGMKERLEELRSEKKSMQTRLNNLQKKMEALKPSPEVTPVTPEVTGVEGIAPAIKGYEEMSQSELQSELTRLNNVIEQYQKIKEPTLKQQAAYSIAVTNRPVVQRRLTELAIPKAEAGVTVQSVTDKLVAGERLSVEETAFYEEHLAEVEDIISKLGKEEGEPSASEQALNMEEVTPEMLARAAHEFFEKVPDLKMFPGEGIPRLPSMDSELETVDTLLKDNPNIKKVWDSFAREQALTDATEKAKETINNYDRLLRETPDKEQIKVIEKEVKDRAKKAGINKERLLTNGWDGLTPGEKRQLTLSLLDDGSVPFDVTRWLKDSRYIFAELEKRTGLPFLTLYERTRTAHGYILRMQDKYLERITKEPKFRQIIRDEAAMERVTLELNSRDPDSKVESPEGLTEEEREMADTFGSTLDEWKPIVRFLRFTEAVEETQNIAKIQEEIPDAPESELQRALGIYNTGDENSLWNYLKWKDWGVRQQGYDPRTIYRRGLEVRRIPFTATRGARHLMSRESLEMPAGQEKGLLRRYDTYNRSMGVRWFLRNEITKLDEMMRLAESKFKSPDEVFGYMSQYLTELQGFPVEGGILHWVIRRVQRWAYPVIFMHPWLGFRNILQPLWSFPQKYRLFTSLIEYRSLPESLRQIGDIRFATVIDQTGRPMRDWMFQETEASFPGELPKWLKVALAPTKLVTKPLDVMSNLSAKIPTMAITDKASRSWAFRAALVRSWKASERYLEDRNTEKWLKDSGASYLTPEQQKYILSLLIRPKMSWAVHGLQEVEGIKAASVKVAEEIVNTTLYMYDRSAASQAHWGAGGRTFGSLLVFPRSTLQMYGEQVAKIVGKETSVEDRITASRNMILLILAGEVLSQFLMTLSGKRRKEYSILNTLTWEIGGLSFGLTREASEVISNLVVAASGSEEDKNRAINNLPNQLSRLGDVLLGFYRIAWDAAETFTDEPTGLDKRYMRKVRAFFDDKYTPEEQEKAERTVIEKFQKALAGSEPPPPDLLEKSLKVIKKVEDGLGEVDVEGKFVTLGALAGSIETSTKNLPDYVLNEDSGYTDLTLFYLSSRDAWEELYKIPADDKDAKSRGMPTREEWRKAHPLEEAMLLFWEKYSIKSSVFRRGTKQGNEVAALLKIWFDQYGIDKTMHKEFANWSLPLTPLTKAE